MERAVITFRITTATAFLVAVAVWLPWVNYAAAPRWAVLSIGLPLAVALLQPRVTWPALLFILTLAWAAASGFWTPSGPDYAQEMWELTLLFLAFLLGQNLTQERAKQVYLALGIGLVFSVVVEVSHLAGHPLLQTATTVPAGLFFNPNMFGEMLFPTAVLMTAVTPLFGLVLIIAALPLMFRAGIVGLFVGLLLCLLSRRRYLGAAIMTVLAAAWLVWTTHLKGYAIGNRLPVWQATIAHLTPLGHGAGSYFASSLTLGNFSERFEYPHNEVLHYLFELGVGALPLLWLMGRALIGKVSYERVAFVVLFVEALFGYPLHVPATLFLGGILMGRLCSRGDLY